MALPRRSWIQFSLRSILWLMLCIAIGFAAYRRGFDEGFHEGAHQRQHVGVVYAKAYDVRDLVLPILADGKPVGLDMDRLMRDITANVLPNTWEVNGGRASITTFQSDRSFIIYHDRDGHESIARYLERRRDSNRQLATGE